MTPIKIHVGKLIDDAHWTAWQKLLVAATALVIVLDGLDNTLLATAIPDLMKDWNLPRTAFATALAMSPLGMLLGGAFGGWLGDRFGRRLALLTSVIAFSVPSAAIYFAGNVTTLGLLRLLAGLGLGGAMPNATALACEYVPRRQRPFAVTLAIVCVPIGAILASFLAARLIPAYGWRNFFLVCGLVPLGLAAVLAMFLSESPHYLARHVNRWPELIALLRRFGHAVPAEAEFEQPAATLTGSLFDIFTPAYRRDTFGLFGAFFFCLMTVYLALQLLVTVLKGTGFTPPEANDIFTWFNLGGVAGALIGAQVIQRFGSKIPMLVLCAIAIVGAFALAAMPIGPANKLAVIAMCILLGTAINAVQVALFALAAHVYPTEIRGRGLGTVLAVGRVGNVLAPYVGIFALGPNQGRVSVYFATYGFGMVAVLFALCAVQRHIARPSS